ncbi:MAG: sulfotransferase family 2 domain-containing protein [Oceanicoccus sp.]
MKKFGENPGLIRKIHRNYKVARTLPKIWRLASPDIGYIKITKVASSSVELMLTKHLHCTLNGNDEADIDKKLIRRYADEYAIHINPYDFSGGKRPEFVFSFVRNPLDRLHSSYINKIVDQRETGKRHNIFWNHGITLDMPFDEFVRCMMRTPDHKIDRHLRSQASCLWDGQKIIADFVGKFENMEEDWKFIAEKFGLPELAHQNRSSKSESKSPYTQETAMLVAERYKNDIELFGYGSEVNRLIDAL